MPMQSLFGDEFNYESEKEKAKKLKSKLAKPKQVSTVQLINSKTVSIEDKLSVIYAEVDRVLGVYKENTILLDNVLSLVNYIDEAIKNKVIVIDTETNNSLDPLTCKLMGPCLYTPGQKNAYVPVNHTDLDGNRLENQVTEEQCREQFERLNNSDCKIIFHNAKFDYQVVYCTCGVKLRIDWDTIIAARLLDENERAGLKEQYITKIDPTIEKYSIDHLFTVPYQYVDPKVFALYAATDSFMTYKLYEWQLAQFNLPDHDRLYNLFLTVEIPMVKVCAEMELTGICLDEEYAKRLSVKYHKLADEVQAKIDRELSKYADKIAAWRLTPEANKKELTAKGNLGKSESEKLENPVKLSSNTQLIILLHSVLKLKPIKKTSGKGAKKHESITVDEEALDKLSEMYDIPLLKLLLEQRGIEKLLSTYIDKMPECRSQVDMRVHAGFEQLGAGTGRMSSKDPNIQNIPSHNPEIRMMFTASPGYVMIGSDFSQQEPRILANYSKDENMIGAYKDGKDLYAVIASQVYHNNYEDNKEFYPDGTMNPDGKRRRTNMKSLLLGLMYGRGVPSIAEQIKTHDGPATKEDIAEAQKIQDDFFNSFPKVKKWIDDTHNNAKRDGYVEDLWGRRRRLPDIQLPDYSCEFDSQNKFNPLLNTSGSYVDDAMLEKAEYYLQKIRACKSNKDRESVKVSADKDGITIHNNSGFISQAERQCVNARVQGGAATMSKKAMIKVLNDPELNSLGFKLLFPVHDELIGEVPIENAEPAKKRLSYLMIHSAEPECTVPMKCDADAFEAWYVDVYTADVKAEYEKLKSTSPEYAFEKLCANHTECTEEQLRSFIS